MNVMLLVPMLRPEKDKLQRYESYPWINDNGLGSLHAYLNAKGHQATLLSWNCNYDARQLAACLQNARPSVVGIKVFTIHFRRVIATLQVVRQTLPDATIVIGGPHPSTSEPANLFEEFGGLIDFAFAGDAEIGLLKLCNLLEQGANKETLDATAVPGLIYQTRSGAKRNPSAFEAPDALFPVDWRAQNPSDFPDLKAGNTRTVFLEDSRGCPAECGHCRCSAINGPKPRKLSLEKLTGQIEKLVNEYGINSLAFTGNSFLSDKDYVSNLCGWMLDQGIKIRWTCTGAAYAHRLEDKSLVAQMRQAGCAQIQLGVESGNPTIRKCNKYPVALKTFERVAAVTNACGIRTTGFYMFGFPGETESQMNDTLKTAATLNTTSISFCTYLPFPGTTSYAAILHRFNLRRIDWSAFDFENPPLLPSVADLAAIKRKLFLGRILERSRLARRLWRAVP